MVEAGWLLSYVGQASRHGREGVSGKGTWEAEVLLGVDVPRDIVDIEGVRLVE
jgi:hypothetical protein